MAILRRPDPSYELLDAAAQLGARHRQSLDRMIQRPNQGQRGRTVTTDIRYGAAFRFAPDGRLVEIHEYATHQEALEAAGLRK